MIRSTETSEQDDAVAIQTAAFIADPVMRWMYPESRSYLEHFPGFVRAFGGAAFDGDGAFLSDCLGGVALWLPPGVHPDGDAIEAFFRKTVSEEKLDDLFGVLEQMDEYHPEESHWYLSIIGVDPARQGQGLGAQLLQHTLARCDEDGLPAYLESSNPANISLYMRHGFEVMGEIRVGDAPLVTPMLRPARSPLRGPGEV